MIGIADHWIESTACAPSRGAATFAALARVAGLGFVVLLLFPLAAAFLAGFGWTWPEADEALGSAIPAGLAWHARHAPLPQMGLLALLALRFWAARRARPGQPPRHWRRRALLALVSLLAAVVAVQRLALVTDAVVRHPFIEPPADERAFQDTLLAAVARALAGMDPDREVMAALVAKDIDRARLLVAGTDLVGGQLLPATRAAYGEATSWPATLQRESLAMLTAAATGKAESLSGIAAVLAVDLTPAGDLRDIGRELGHLASGQEVDRVILGLSVLGLGLTAGTLIMPAPGAAMLPGKAVLKAGARMGRVAPGLAADMRRATTELVDLDGLATSARRMELSPTMVTRHLRPAAADDLAKAAGELGGIAREAGPAAAILALRHADSLAELPLLARVARSFGDRAQTVLGILGRDTRHAFRVWRASSRALLELRGWSGLLAAALAALAASATSLGSTRSLRRLALRAGRG